MHLAPFWELPHQTLDEKGRCCGRKPMVYKGERKRWCSRCSRSYHLTENRMVSDTAYLANGHQRLRHPQGGGDASFREGHQRYFFFPGLTLPIAVSVLVSTTYCDLLGTDQPGALRSYSSVSVSIFTLGGTFGHHKGFQFHIQAASAKFNLRYRQ